MKIAFTPAHSTQELVAMFGNTDLQNITRRMNMLEKLIANQQRQLRQLREGNREMDATAWASFENECDNNLHVWDAMKIARDNIKTD